MPGLRITCDSNFQELYEFEISIWDNNTKLIEAQRISGFLIEEILKLFNRNTWMCGPIFLLW